MNQMQTPWEKTRIFLGLGNPGDEFEGTYHNAGLIGCAELAARAGIAETFRKRGRAARIVSADHEPWHFALSRTFMNESGGAASEALRVFGAKPAELVILHDDADLAVGVALIEFGRGAAGHHGVAAVIQSLGTNQFWRIRIGIRPPGEAEIQHGRRGRRPAGDFVLHRMSRGDQATITAAIAKLPMPFDASCGRHAAA